VEIRICAVNTPKIAEGDRRFQALAGLLLQSLHGRLDKPRAYDDEDSITPPGNRIPVFQLGTLMNDLQWFIR
jgi:hypothetical protein